MDVDHHPSLMAVMVAQGLTSLPVSVVREDGATWGSFLERPARAFLDTATEVWSGVDPERIRAWAANARRSFILGWLMRLEPTTTGITIQGSTN